LKEDIQIQQKITSIFTYPTGLPFIISSSTLFSWYYYCYPDFSADSQINK